VIQSVYHLEQDYWGKMLYSKQELQEGHFEDIIIGEHFNGNEPSA
jgi:hypothetical protein